MSQRIPKRIWDDFLHPKPSFDAIGIVIWRSLFPMLHLYLSQILLSSHADLLDQDNGEKYGSFGSISPTHVVLWQWFCLSYKLGIADTFYNNKSLITVVSVPREHFQCAFTLCHLHMQLVHHVDLLLDSRKRYTWEFITYVQRRHSFVLDIIKYEQYLT